jgi:hypothetical protein
MADREQRDRRPGIPWWRSREPARDLPGHLAARLRDERLRRGWSLRRAGWEIGVSYSADTPRARRAPAVRRDGRDADRRLPTRPGHRGRPARGRAAVARAELADADRSLPGRIHAGRNLDPLAGGTVSGTPEDRTSAGGRVGLRPSNPRGIKPGGRRGWTAPLCVKSILIQVVGSVVAGPGRDLSEEPVVEAEPAALDFVVAPWCPPGPPRSAGQPRV